MRKLHYIVGLLGILAFALTGQVMLRHQPNMESLEPGQHMMYLSRHIYLLGGAVANMLLGIYLKLEGHGWRRNLQSLGSILIVASPVLLLFAFAHEPGFGLAGRSARSAFGLFMLLGGTLAHFVATLGAAPRN